MSKQLPSIGDVLYGIQTYRTDNRHDWHPYPRYKVIAIHEDQNHFFWSLLDSNGDTIQEGKFGVFDCDSTEWDYSIPEPPLPTIDQFNKDEILHIMYTALTDMKTSAQDVQACLDSAIKHYISSKL